MLGISDMNTLTSPSDIISTNLPENNSDHYFNNCIYIYFQIWILFLFHIGGGILYLDIIFFISTYFLIYK